MDGYILSQSIEVLHRYVFYMNMSAREVGNEKLQTFSEYMMEYLPILSVCNQSAIRQEKTKGQDTLHLKRFIKGIIENAFKFVKGECVIIHQDQTGELTPFSKNLSIYIDSSISNNQDLETVKAPNHHLFFLLAQLLLPAAKIFDTLVLSVYSTDNASSITLMLSLPEENEHTQGWQAKKLSVNLPSFASQKNTEAHELFKKYRGNFESLLEDEATMNLFQLLLFFE